MTDAKTNKIKLDVNDLIGYGKPPQGKRFVKGQSGNPNGRPRKNSPERLPHLVRDLVLEITAQPVTIKDGGQTRQVSKLHAVILAQIATAGKGNALAQRDLIQLTARCQAETKQERKERFEFWSGYKTRLEAVMADGDPCDDMLPHPNDVILNDDGTVSFDGPVSEDDKQAIEQCIRCRDALLLRSEWDVRQFKLDQADDPLQRMTQLSLTAWLFDRALPPRLRWKETELVIKIMNYQSQPKRAFKRMVEEAWMAALGSKPDLSGQCQTIRGMLDRLECQTIEEFGDYIRLRAEAESVVD